MDCLKGLVNQACGGPTTERQSNVEGALQSMLFIPPPSGLEHHLLHCSADTN